MLESIMRIFFGAVLGVLCLSGCGSVPAQRLYNPPVLPQTSVARLWSDRGSFAFATEVNGQKVTGSGMDYLVIELLPGKHHVVIRSNTGGTKDVVWHAQAGKDYYIAVAQSGYTNTGFTGTASIQEGNPSGRPVSTE